jgi:hypothetical protein
MDHWALQRRGRDQALGRSGTQDLGDLGDILSQDESRWSRMEVETFRNDLGTASEKTVVIQNMNATEKDHKSKVRQRCCRIKGGQSQEAVSQMQTSALGGLIAHSESVGKK